MPSLGKLSWLALLFALFAFPAKAQIVNNNGGGAANGTLASNFGVTGYGKVCFDATLTNASAVINSAGECGWTQADVGSIGWATNICSSTVCGFTQSITSTTIMPSTQVKVFRIASVQSATQITVDCTAPGNCASPNPSSLGTAGHVTIFWAPDGAGTDTTALNAAWAASFPANGCGDLELPVGMIPFNSALFTALPAGQNCTSQTLNLFTINQAIGPNNVGPSIHGKGPAATILVARPDFNWSSCSSGAATAIGGLYGIDFANFTITSFGQSLFLSGLSATCSSLITSAGGHMTNVYGFSWANGNPVAGDGFNIGANIGYEIVSDSSFAAFGAGASGNATCHSSGDNDQISNSVCLGMGGYQSFRNSATILQTSNMQFGPASRPNDPALINDANKVWQDVTGRCEGNGQAFGQTVGTNIIQNSGTMYMTNFANGCQQVGVTGSPQGIANLSGGTLSLVQYKPYNSTTWTVGINNAGTVLDAGGNGFGGPVTNTGTWVGDESTTGVAQTSGNWSVPAGAGAGQWGTSPSVGTCTGFSKIEQCTITVGSGTVGANPILTVTFPTSSEGFAGFPVAPICDAKMTGGTAAIQNFVTGAVSATTAAFTYQGTPGASTTIILKVSCGLP